MSRFSPTSRAKLLELQMRDGADIPLAAMRSFGVAIGIPFVTNIGGDAEGYRWSLVLPSGEVRTVRLDDDDRFVLTAEDLLDIERSRTLARRAA
ncbi:MAG: hypothetical protein QM753_04865 [Thermomicrobiales bacterium]